MSNDFVELTELTSELEEEESFKICLKCRKGLYLSKLDFINHWKNCYGLSKKDSPITTRWYSIEELQVMKKRKEKL